jgi:hypothetical protein
LEIGWKNCSSTTTSPTGIRSIVAVGDPRSRAVLVTSVATSTIGGSALEIRVCRSCL